MKKTALILSIIINALIIRSYGQDEGSFRLMITGEKLDIRPTDFHAMGIEGQYFVSPAVSLNYQYSLGWNGEGEYYFHYPALAAGILLVGFIDELALLSMMFPEGVSYHTYPRDWLEVEVYMHPLSTDINILGNNNLTMTGSLGMRMHLKIGDSISIAPHTGLKYIYSRNIFGQVTGVSLGFIF
ncbi:MAG: hypothetical protein ABIJ16_02960 [Bacteroidota bacterium]